MITVYQFPRAWSCSSASPYCVKVTAFMQLTGIPFKVVSLMSSNKAPYKKLPYITDGELTIADSNVIINYLMQTYQVSLDSHLNEQQAAQALAIQSMIEDKLYYILVYARWIDEDTNKLMKRAFKRGLPPLIDKIAFYLAQRSAKNQVYFQGIGRHPKTQIYAFGKKILQALLTLLGDKPYLLGEKLATVDISAYAFLSALIRTPIDHPLRHWLLEQQAILDYCERVEKDIKQAANKSEEDKND